MSLKPTDILLIGADSGRAAMRRVLTGDAPQLTIIESDDNQASITNALQAHTPKNILLASHTMSLEAAADELDGIPIHRTLPPLAEAARLTCTRHVALVAMPQTLAHPLTKRQITLFSERGLRVTPISCADLEIPATRYVSAKILPDITAMRELMEPIRADARIDTVILASGHASALRGMLEKAAFRPFYWVDGITVSAKRFLALTANDTDVFKKA